MTIRANYTDADLHAPAHNALAAFINSVSRVVDNKADKIGDRIDPTLLPPGFAPVPTVTYSGVWPVRPDVPSTTAVRWLTPLGFQAVPPPLGPDGLGPLDVWDNRGVEVIPILSVPYKPVVGGGGPLRPVGYLTPDAGIGGVNNVFRQDVRNAPLHPNSANIVANIANQVATRYGGVAGSNILSYNNPTYVVNRQTPRYRVGFINGQNKPSVPTTLYNPLEGGHFLNVPIPIEAEPANGTDGSITIYDPDEQRVWEMWRFARDKAGPDGVVVPGPGAVWGGRLDNVDKAIGYFHNGMGATATGLLAAAGQMTIADAVRGFANHGFAIIVVEGRAGFSWPAQRTDLGGSDPNLPQEGMQFRMRADANLASFNLHPLALMIAEAVKTYPIVITDRGGAVSVMYESAAAYSKANGGPNLWSAYMGSTPGYSIMARFPWHLLECLPQDYGKAAAIAAGLS